MDPDLRLGFLALFAVGPVVALLALVRRRADPPADRHRAAGWRYHVPTVLLPVEWLLPPALILLGLGEIRAGWLPVRLAGLAVGLGGAALIVWAAAVLGRFL